MPDILVYTIKHTQAYKSGQEGGTMGQILAWPYDKNILLKVKEYVLSLKIFVLQIFIEITSSGELYFLPHLFFFPWTATLAIAIISYCRNFFPLLYG